MLELVWIGLACAVTSMVLGMLWWGPLFGKQWLKAMGWDAMTESELKEKQKGAGPGYAASIIGAIVGGLILWLFFDSSFSAWDRFGKAGYGSILGLLVWAGFVVPASVVNTIFEDRDWTIFRIDASYRFVTMALWGLWVGLLHV